MQKVSKFGVVKAGFSIDSKELKAALKLVKSSFKNQGKKLYPYCEITIKAKKIELSVAGIKHLVPCETNGPARFVIGFDHFCRLVNDRPPKITRIDIGNDFMTVNDRVSVTVQSWFFKKDTILRTIDLPLNYGLAHILTLPQKYTAEEIELNHLDKVHKKTHDELWARIEKIQKLLKPYELNPKEVRNVIYNLVLKSAK